MQNSVSSENYIKHTNVINILSETLYREAEDEFYYFNKTNSAYKKLKRAVELTPNHLKSILFLADVTFVKGNIKKSLELYKKASSLKKSDFKIFASIANCYKSLGDFEKALTNINLALESDFSSNYLLYSQLLEMKVEILILLRKYQLAYKTLNFARAQQLEFNLNFDELNYKIKLKDKIKSINLKIV